MIIDFCSFQYGELKEDKIDNKPHQSYIKLLKKHRLWQDYLYSLHRDKEKAKDKEIEILPQEEEFPLDILDEEIETGKGEKRGISDTNPIKDEKYWEERVNKVFNEKS